eukprot:TRINITY_DN58081_c0_g1_i2.p1 TRINITY_DN58081_c0_g1~~TRINITY_DN58081_c0_g1_i2.p1  ORF type:complete len:129 (-),score=20.11 TRINITY_DN58081_c0_g1_i2:202-588(-)
MYVRQLREAEGGRAGGYNDRQDVSDRRKAYEEDEDGFDDFGRRRGKRSGAEDAASRADRARIALERLKKKAVKQQPLHDRRCSPSPPCLRRSRSRNSHSPRASRRSRSRSSSGRVKSSSAARGQGRTT